MVVYSDKRRGFCAGADLRELYHELVSHKAEGGSMEDAHTKINTAHTKMYRCQAVASERVFTTDSSTSWICQDFRSDLPCIFPQRFARFL